MIQGLELVDPQAFVEKHGGNGARRKDGVDEGRIEVAVREILFAVGEDPDREGLTDTPERVDKALRYLTRGYRESIDDVLNEALFTVDYDELVIVKDIEFYSLCEHHLLPFFGRCHVGYLPRDRVIGLSKIPRLVEMYARRLQIQERMTQQIATTLDEVLSPLGVGVVIKAQHLCCAMRGVKKPNTRMTTSAMIGCFKADVKTKQEFLSLIS